MWSPKLGVFKSKYASMRVCLSAYKFVYIRNGVCQIGFSGHVTPFLVALTLSVSLSSFIFPPSVFFSCAFESDRKEAVWFGPTCRVWLWLVESSLVFGRSKTSWPQTWPRSEAPHFRTLYTLSFSSRLFELLLDCECFLWFFRGCEFWHFDWVAVL